MHGGSRWPAPSLLLTVEGPREGLSNVHLPLMYDSHAKATMRISTEPSTYAAGTIYLSMLPRNYLLSIANALTPEHGN